MFLKNVSREDVIKALMGSFVEGVIIDDDIKKQLIFETDSYRYAIIAINVIKKFVHESTNTFLNPFPRIGKGVKAKV